MTHSQAVLQWQCTSVSNIQCSHQTCLDQLSCPLGTGLVHFCSLLLPAISVLPAFLWVFAVPVLCPSKAWMSLIPFDAGRLCPLGAACCRRTAQDDHSRRPPPVWSASSPVGRAPTASLGFDFAMAGLPNFSSVEKSDSPAIVKWAHVEIAVVCRAVNQLYCLCSKWQKDAGGYAVLPQVSVRLQPLCCANVTRHWAPFCFS